VPVGPLEPAPVGEAAREPIRAERHQLSLGDHQVGARGRQILAHVRIRELALVEAGGDREHRQAAAPSGEQGRTAALLDRRQPPAAERGEPDRRGDLERGACRSEQRGVDQRPSRHHRDQHGKQAGGLRQLRSQT
jgi:hypothetical protein